MGIHPEERCVTQGQKKLRRIAIGSAVTIVLAVIIAVLTLAPMPAVGASATCDLGRVGRYCLRRRD